MSRLRRLASRLRLRLAVWLRRAPLVGEVKNRMVVDAADFDDDPEFGSSRAVPTVLEIKLESDAKAPAHVGAIVKRKFFPDEGDFIFNVAFSCGDPGLFGRGNYTDPRSIWFNIFFGYYQIDVPRSSWARPFGYERADSGAAVAARDIVRIGKADWNYFSNYVYGVPEEAIAPFDGIDVSTVGFRHLGRRLIGESCWDEIELDDVEVVSAYTAPGERHRLVDHDRLLSPLWRIIFGRPCPRPEHTASFVPTRVRARLYMSFAAAEDAVDIGGPTYQTLIFGGTTRRDWPDAGASRRFLERQLEAVRDVIEKSYPRAGFAPAEPRAQGAVSGVV